METSMAKFNERLLLSAKETARALSVSERTLWSLTYPRGALRSTKIGSRVLYSRQALVEWIAEQSKGGAV